MEFRRRLSGALLGTVLSLLLPPTSSQATDPFVNETIQSGGFVGAHISLAVDQRGQPHVVYWDFGNFTVIYATRESGVWMTETIQAAVFTGAETDIAIDPSGVPHISFHIFTAGPSELHYAHRTGGSWTVENVDLSGDDVGRYNAIALESDGTPHIFYYNATTGDGMHAERDGAWSTEIVIAPGNVGAFGDIAIDPSDRPNVTYFNLDTGTVWFAIKNNTWIHDPINTPAGMTYTGIALNASGEPYVLIQSGGFPGIWFRDPDDAAWTGYGGAPTSSAASYGSIVVNERGHAVIAYQDIFNGKQDMQLAAWTGVTYDIQDVALSSFDVGSHNDLAIDPEGNYVVAYYDVTNGDAMLGDAGIWLTAALDGATWPVGAERSVTWRGAGEVDIMLSTDGGGSYETLATGLTGGSGTAGGQYTFHVPHTPSKFCKLRIERKSPFAVAEMDSFLTIEADVSLLNFVVTLPGPPGATLSWSTDPGPEDLAGYRIDRQRTAGGWTTLVSLTKETSYRDEEGRPGDVYRLFAVNGFGAETLLATRKASRAPAPAALRVFPNPLPAGELLNVTFATAGGLGGGSSHTTVIVYDVAGRKVATIADGAYGAGIQATTWNGLNDDGELVSSGIYLLRSTSGGVSTVRKLSVVR